MEKSIYEPTPEQKKYQPLFNLVANPLNWKLPTKPYAVRTLKEAEKLRELIKDQYPNENMYNVMHNLLQEQIDINGFKAWLKEKRQELQQPEYNPQTWQGSYALLGKEQIIDELLAELEPTFTS